ncbi:hypothetical protein Q5H93_20520 [Hymenobacter sp. ASUV-10]|uniref:Uncharacterized protein n=1 Tax=Hymenobacter aranciens TaxID=3063996 RepID=A0ABT9BFW9_9BACT|nr:hypothetical protein [Hymenobacter sp. ASUV-10]MDO7877142.1 hypothetical protein [Hymenobacter sp. ASUV-10]
MDDRQLNQYRMGETLDQFLAQRDLSASEEATAEAADVRAAFGLLKESVGQGTTSTKENTQDAGAAETKLLQLLPALLGSLRSVARKLPLTDDDRPALLARATISAKQLDKLRPAPLRDVVGRLLQDATTYQKPLQKYGYSDAVHTIVTNAYNDFAATVGTTRTLQKGNQSIHRSTDELLLDFMKQCYELDDPMEIFRVLDNDLYRDYRAARKVGKSGGGKKKDDEAGQ